jgi:hypothetical protein
MLKYNHKDSIKDPLAIHFSGGPKSWDWRLWDFCEKRLNDFKIIVPKNIRIVTYNNDFRRRKRGILEKICINNGVNYYNCARPNVEFNWMEKIYGFMENCDKIAEEYVLCVDSYDVFLQGDLTRLLNVKEDIIFQSERGDQLKKLRKLNMEYINDKEKSILPDKDFFHLNAGCFFGKKEKIKNLMTILVEQFKQNNICDDQIQWRLLRLSNGISIDCNLDYFLNPVFTNFNDYILEETK